MGPLIPGATPGIVAVLVHIMATDANVVAEDIALFHGPH